MKSCRIAVIPGDGVGEEVSREGLKVLDAVAKKHGSEVGTMHFGWGCDYYLEHGNMMPDVMLAILKDFDNGWLF